MRHLGLNMLTATSLLMASANVTAAQTIWLGPTSDKVMPEVDPDYLQLFEDAAPWQRALSHTRVFEMSRWYVATQPEATLRQVFGFFRDHRIALAVIFGFIPVAGCSEDVEGAAHRPERESVGCQAAQTSGRRPDVYDRRRGFVFRTLLQGEERVPVPNCRSGCEFCT